MKQNCNRNKLYLCVGENFGRNVRMGDCGKVKSLMEWLKHLSKQDEDYLNQFFDESYTNDDVTEYVFQSWGKRLEKVKGE